jgi:hypothetical protein
VNYYTMCDDLFSPDIVLRRWHLGGLKYGNDHLFYDPPVELMEPGRWPITILKDGVETDFSTISGTLPIISQKVKDALSDIEEVANFYRNTVMEPVHIEGKTTSTSYYIMITEDKFDCVDEKRSVFHKWSDEDAPTEGHVGQYASFETLVIDPTKVYGHNIFRLVLSLGTLIVSQLVKDRMESVAATGVVFTPVT